MSEQLMLTLKCPRCGEDDEVALLPLTNGGCFTHYYICPRTHEPVSLTVRVDGDGAPIEIDSEIMEYFMEAMRAPGWIMHLSRRKAGGGIAHFRKASNFIHADFPVVLADLRSFCESMINRPKVETLPTADIPEDAPKFSRIVAPSLENANAE